MPSPNAANKNAAKKTVEKNAADLGQKLARRKSQDFASKIQGWNDSGAGVFRPQEEVVVVEERGDEADKHGDIVEVVLEPSEGGEAVPEQEEGSHTPLTPKSPASKNATSTKTSREVDLERKAWVRRKSKPQVEIAAEVKHAGTPKKRVVSDGHWRKDKPAKIETERPEKDVAPKPITIRRSVVSVGLKVPPSVQDFVEEEPPPLRVRPLRKARSRSRSREREATPDYEDSGVKVYIKRRRRSRTVIDPKDAKTSESSFTAGSSTGKPSSSTDITTPIHSPTKEHPPKPTTERRDKQSRRSYESDNDVRRADRRKSKTPVPAENTKPRSSPKPVTTPVSSPAVPAGPRVFGGRIEGWLAGTQDPFLEAPDSTLSPEPLKVHRRKSSKMLNDQSDSGSVGQRESRRPSPSTTPTLKRSGARRTSQSPVKDRISRGSSPTAIGNGSPRVVSNKTERRQPSEQNSARRHPSTGNHLSTAASAETFHDHTRRRPSDESDHPTVVLEGSVLSRASDGDQTWRESSGLKRRMTKHSDLISVLSLPRAENAGIKSARSIRTRRAPSNNATLGDIMNEVTTDELKYQRELRTLVDGVIPVLLSHVLQKTDATGTKRLFSGSSPDGQAITRPIVEMGVALERLKAAHKRIPLHQPEDLLRWAVTTSKAYADYLTAWRLGFEDIVVNLAPAEENEGLPRNANGELTSGDGERVDVAYLLKRPLVRLKHLNKTFKAIDQIRPSAIARDMSTKYYELVQEARQRANDERARLEDEAAASIDPTRARDPRTLALLAGVNIDPSRSVRARDYFDLDLNHSSGQQVVCKVELILRDDAPDHGTSSDVLFCEVSTTGRWLLFPPIPASYLSARPGDKGDEIVIMVRGMLAGAQEWREVMSLQSGDSGAISEWLDMLSSTPVPSRLARHSSFNAARGPYVMSGGLGHAASIARPPSPSEVDVPLGEPADETAPKWDGSEVNSVVGDIPPSRLRRSTAKRHRSHRSSSIVEDPYEQVRARADHISSQERYDEEPAYQSRSRYRERPKSTHFPSSYTTSTTASTAKKDYSVWLPGTSDRSDSSDEDDYRPRTSQRPGMHRRTSSVPSADMPTIPKLRKSSQPTTPYQSPAARRYESAPTTPQEPQTAPAKLQKRWPLSSKEEPTKKDSQPNTRPTSLGLRSSMLPSFTPAFLKRHRRSSSPLKHEYEPSSASNSSSESDLSDVDDAESITSESSAGEEAISTLGELKNFKQLGALRPPTQPSSPKSVASAGADTVGPSDSVSQAPYRNVPTSSAQTTKTVACIFSWSDRGTWDTLHPGECSIVVTPGLIEAFDLAQAHAVASNSGGEAVSPSQRGVKPLVALELTPLVPLRRGTALDISIRSPPTSNSLLRTSNNVMFRSRSPEECEKLYGLINRARIDNPTYIALQNARGPIATSNWAEVMEQRNAARDRSSSWLRLGSRKSSTYRSNGSRPASAAATESSIGTMHSAFSALRRFNGSNRFFNIAKSTLTSREGAGTRSTYSDSLSSGAATPIAIDPRMGTPLGINNAKIRLYIRETASKWRDLGSARLTVMLPPRPDPTVPANPKTTGMEKRILICGKSKGETLLDVTLGESCFERVARTGIAVSVWEEATGPNGELGQVGAVGGVSSARSKVYMVQMKSERDAAFTFGLVGKLRY